MSVNWFEERFVSAILFEENYLRKWGLLTYGFEMQKNAIKQLIWIVSQKGRIEDKN